MDPSPTEGAPVADNGGEPQQQEVATINTVIDGVVPAADSGTEFGSQLAVLQSIWHGLAGQAAAAGQAPQAEDKENIDQACTTLGPQPAAPASALPPQAQQPDEGEPGMADASVRRRTARAVALELPATPYHPPPPRDPASAHLAPAPTPGTGLPATTPFAAQVLASLEALMARPPPPPKPVSVPARSAGAAAAAARPAPQRATSAAAAAAATAAAAAAAAASGAARRPAAPPAGSRRGCNCKKSQCLKLYCECFAAGDFCAAGCACANCVNTQADFGSVLAARGVVLSKNPAAFEEKVTKREGHRRGCRCKRSRCLKKYCECFHAGAACNPEVCQCEGCRNKGEGAARVGAPRGRPPAAARADNEARGGAAAEMEAAAAPPPAAAAAAAAAQAWPAGVPAFDPALFPGLSLPAAVASAALLPPGAAGQAEQMQGVLAALLADPAAVAALAAAAAARAAGAAPPLPMLPAPAPAPAAAGNPAPALTSSHLSSDLGLGLGGDDTAGSPAPRLLAARNRTMTGGGGAGPGKAGARPAPPPLPRHTQALALAEEGGAAQEASARGKRPRRAASGGVAGAVAAATSDWGLGLVSPPLKRPAPGPAAPPAQAAAAQAAPWPAERGAALRRALLGGGGGAHRGDGDEEDAVSALVGLNGWAS